MRVRVIVERSGAIVSENHASGRLDAGSRSRLAAAVEEALVTLAHEQGRLVGPSGRLCWRCDALVSEHAEAPAGSLTVVAHPETRCPLRREDALAYSYEGRSRVLRP